MTTAERVTIIKQKLSAAFSNLRKENIWAKHKTICCSCCSWARLGHDYETAKVKPIGAVFYHNQDAKHLERDAHVYIAFGGFDGHDSLTVGHRLVEALKAEGLTVKWDGTENDRPDVSLDWQDKYR